MTALLITTTAVLANVLGALMALPQAWRLARSGRVEGVSVVWAAVSVGVNGWWIGYALAVDALAIIPVSVLSVLLYGSIAAMFMRTRRGAARVMAALSVAIAVPGLALAVGGWHVLGITVGLAYGAQLMPAVAEAYRTHDLSGVAPATWTMAVAEGAMWTGYAVLVRDAAIAVGGTAGMVFGGLILVRLWSTEHLGRRGQLSLTATRNDARVVSRSGG